MIHYHGGPIKPTSAARDAWTARHGLTSFEWPEQVALMFEVCQSAVVDNGAFSKWKAALREYEKRTGALFTGQCDLRKWCADNGVELGVNVEAYGEFVRMWCRHPAFDGAIVPDDILGNEDDNAKMCARWLALGLPHGCGWVVWHLHESLERLEYLIRCVKAGVYGRLCLGSSGKWAEPGSPSWWERMEEVREVAADKDGVPHVKLHGLRMLDPTIFSQIPLASADSCNVGLNIGIDNKWAGPYKPLTANTRALVLSERIERHATANRWSRRVGIQKNLELIG